MRRKRCPGDYVNLVESIRFAKNRGIEINVRELMQKCHIAKVKGLGANDLWDMVDDRPTDVIVNQIVDIRRVYFKNKRDNEEVTNLPLVDTKRISDTQAHNGMDELIGYLNQILALAYKIKFSKS